VLGTGFGGRVLQEEPRNELRGVQRGISWMRRTPADSPAHAQGHTYATHTIGTPPIPLPTPYACTPHTNRTGTPHTHHATHTVHTRTAHTHCTHTLHTHCARTQSTHTFWAHHITFYLTVAAMAVCSFHPNKPIQPASKLVSRKRIRYRTYSVLLQSCSLS